MVTGFNTDVKHDGKVYHVQTEDKGSENPVIETLIYRGGEILASRRSSYADLRSQEFDETAVAERIEAQHNRMIADVRAGRYDVKDRRPFGEGIISNKSFDEVVLEYLKSLAAGGRIGLEVAGGDNLAGGETATLDLVVSRVGSREGLPGAKVKVKLICSAGKPRVLAQGETGEEGRVSVTCDLPTVTEGRAALIIEATSGTESIEVKRSVAKSARKAAG
jgi:hypothetical protein